MIDYYSCIHCAFPGITDEHFRLEEDESGPRIVFWDSALGSKPTLQYLETFYLKVQQAIKKAEIKETVEVEFITSSRGWLTTGLINNVRTDAGRTHLENFRNLKTYAEAKGLSNIVIRLFDNSFTSVTIDELDIIIIELIGYGLWLYQRKWELEMMIDSTTTIEELEAISFFP